MGGGESYTSAKLQSRADYLYGKVSIRARLPRGQATGTWAALWMMPRTSEYGGWPKSGEIDIMEHVGYDKGKLHGTVHAGCCYHSIGTQVGGSTRADVGDWHTYQFRCVALAVTVATTSALPEVESATQPKRKVTTRSAQLYEGLPQKMCYLQVSLISFRLVATSQTGKYSKALDDSRHATTTV